MAVRKLSGNTLSWLVNNILSFKCQIQIQRVHGGLVTNHSTYSRMVFIHREVQRVSTFTLKCGSLCSWCVSTYVPFTAEFDF